MIHIKNNNLTISTVYRYDDAIFNLGEKGAKMKYDALTGQYFTYASGDNIKHCIKDEFSNATGIYRPKNYFVKDKKDNSKEQLGVLTEISLDNPHCRIFGDWNPNPFSIKNKKYEKTALKAVIELSDSQPLHPYLVSTTKDCGVRNGNSTDGLAFKSGEKYMFSIDEMIENNYTTKEKAELLFNSVRKSNFIEGKNCSSGLYVHNTILRINEFKYVNISNAVLNDDDKENLISKGYSFDVVNNNDVLVVPTDIAIRDFCALVDALFNYDFSSNNSTHYGLREFLRTTVALNNASMVPNSIIAAVRNGEKKADIEMLGDEEASSCNLYTFTSNVMKKYCVQNNVNYSLMAESNAINKIKEIGTEILSKL